MHMRNRICLLICICLQMHVSADTNAIDTLLTKEHVRTFLKTSLGRKGIIAMGGECAELYFPRVYIPKPHSSDPDTIIIKDPVTDSIFIHIAPHDTAADRADWERILEEECCFPANKDFKYLDEDLDRNEWQFYKADVDGNGLTDLIIDWGQVIVVLDKGSGIEGHIIHGVHYPDTHGFKRFITLPAGNTALLLRNDQNIYKDHFTDKPGKVSYITYAKAGIVPYPPFTNNDTLYKIITGDAYGMEISYVDTLDMRLYNLTDTVVYIAGGFTPFRLNTRSETISRICYLYYLSTDLTGDRFGGQTCIEINKDGSCILQNDSRIIVSHRDYNANDTLAFFTGRENTNRLKTLWEFASYIDLKTKEDDYHEETDHTSGGMFAIYFDDGTVKKIGFWGSVPIELGYLSKELSEISQHVRWQLASTKQPFRCPCR